jgi:hypothetical protein
VCRRSVHGRAAITPRLEQCARGARPCPHRRGHLYTVHGPPPGTVKATGRCLRFRRGKSIGGVWHRRRSRPRARRVPAAHERCIHVIVEEVVHLMHQRGISWEAANEGRVRRIRGARVGVGVGIGDVGDLLHERIGISVRQLWSPSDVVPRVGWGPGSGLVSRLRPGARPGRDQDRE